MIYVTSPTAVKEYAAKLRSFDIVGLDIETAGAVPNDPYAANIRLVSICGVDDITEQSLPIVFDIMALGGIPDEVVNILTDPNTLKVIHNASFELKFFLKHGIVVEPIWDTMAAEHVLSGGTKFPQDLALDAVVRSRFNETIDKTLQKSDWGGTLSEAHVKYAADDAYWAARIYLSQRKQADAYRRVIELEHRVVYPVAWMTLAGVKLDVDRFLALAEYYRAQAEQLAERWARAARPYASRQTFFDTAAVNVRSARQVLEILRAAGLDVKSTDPEDLVAYRGHELVDLLFEYRFYEKRRSTYGTNLVEYINPVTGRIHPDWWPLRAASGRMACSNPNLQNIPRDSAIRACIRAEAGNRLIKADYSQIELRIVAELADERRMIAAFRDGVDLHAMTARIVLGRNEVTPEARQLAKAVNFGLVYGMGAGRLRRYAWQSFGVALSEEEAAAIRQRFFDYFPAITTWHRRISREKEVLTLLGRPRRFDLPYFNEQVNHPVQGTGAEMLKNALCILWQTRHVVPGAVPILAVHDEIVVEAPENIVDRAAAWLKFSMLAGAAEFLRKVPVEVEVRVGETWEK